MASSPYQKIISSVPPVQCGRNHESKRRPLLLFRLEDEDGICYQDHEVLSHRSWPPSNHLRIPVTGIQGRKPRLVVWLRTGVSSGNRPTNVIEKHRKYRGHR